MIGVYASAYAPWALPTLAALNLFFAVMFYWLCVGLLAGLRASTINSELEVADAWTARVIQISATLVLYMTGDTLYQFIAIFSMPWILTNTFTDTFATLVKWQILEVTDKEE